MACLSPIPANQDELGAVTLRHTLAEARAEAGQYLELSCGACDACRARSAQSWAIRSFHESLSHTRLSDGVKIPNGCFITLTYNDEHLPGDLSLDVLHWQLFVKKLRNRCPGRLSYLHCGEYGSNGTKRPHYHACLFGVDFHEDRTIWTQDKNGTQWRSAKLEECWSDSDGQTRGFCTLSPLNFATAAYTAGYVTKKLRYNAHLDDRVETAIADSYTDPHGKTYNWTKWVSESPRKPEYITMSRRPGLGQKWIEANMRTVYPRDLVVIDGRKYRPPPYYDKQLKLYDPCLYDQVMEQRAEYSEEIGPTYPNELEARNLLYRAKFKNSNLRTRNKIQ